MRIAILSDIHANREALEAVLRAAGEVDRLVILGDIVGYGADPGWCVDRVTALRESGAIVIRGNHDQAACEAHCDMNTHARTAIEWTRLQLSAEQKRFLMDLPLSVVEDDRLYVHAEGSAPAHWHYVTDVEDAQAHFSGTSQRVSFCGHIHMPALYCQPPLGKITKFVPNSETGIPLLQQRRWLAVMGAVGQPRDDNPGAAFAIYDTDRRELCFRRAAYDIETAQDKIRAAGLPEILATRLSRGY
jgi:diadenosine tetraphosphatase ApaH/serine/threonine PP2A family protein phosphatase